MLVDQVPRSFIMKNNNYSHCPLKKRPVPVLPAEDEVKIKTEAARRRPESFPTTQIKKEDDAKRSFSPIAEELIVVDDIPEPENLSTKPEDLSRSAEKSPLKRPISPEQAYIVAPPMGIAPTMHPVAKKARVEVLQHESPHFLSGKGGPLEPLNLNTPVELLSHYAPPSWAPPPMYPSHYLPYHASYPMYPAYPVPAYPDQSAVSPPLTCATIQRPIARSYASHWDHCAALSPTSSLRSPPPVTPEDLSSPGSESGRSSAGSTSAGPAVVKSPGGSSGPSSSAPRYQCPDCGKSYSTYSGLSKHQQFHCAAAEGQAKKSFSCKYCEKVYVSLGALKMHIRTHTLPCKCHLCGKAFSRPWLLQGHIRTHTGEKPFSCQHCNRAFADRSNLRAHLQTHSDVKKYSCSSCSKTFSRMSLLTKHQEGGCPGVSMNPMGYAC